VFNFPLRKRNNKEKYKLGKIKELRRIEMAEKQWAYENKHEELIKLRDVIRRPDNYIVNPKSGPQD